MPRLLLAGAGHAHMAVMAAIPELVAKGHQVTAIGPGERHYYSGMGPGMLGGTYQPPLIRPATWRFWSPATKNLMTC